MMKIHWLSGEFTDEVPCHRQASAGVGEPAKAAGSPGSPFGKGTTLINQKFPYHLPAITRPDDD